MRSAANSLSWGERVPIMTVPPGSAVPASSQTAGSRLSVASVPANAPTADECGPPPSRSQSRPVPGPAQKPKAKGCSHRPARCRLGGGSLASASHNDLQDLSYLCNAIDIRKCQEPRRNFPDGSLGSVAYYQAVLQGLREPAKQANKQAIM